MKSYCDSWIAVHITYSVFHERIKCKDSREKVQSEKIFALLSSFKIS